MASKDPIERLLEGNKTFVQRSIKRDPNFFRRLALRQAPEILWIGCADSRVPETTITNYIPGDIFVHRNIANTLLPPDDKNSASVIQYAVQELKVAGIVVCGHTKCGGAAAALHDKPLGDPLNKWIHPLRDLRRRHQAEIDRLPNNDAKADRIAELNVQLSLEVAQDHPAVKAAINAGNFSLHGMIFDIGSGKLRPLMAVPQSSGNDTLEVGATFIISIRDDTGNVLSVMPTSPNDVRCRKYEENNMQQWKFVQFENHYFGFINSNTGGYLGRNQNQHLCAVSRQPGPTERLIITHLRQGCLLSAEIGGKMLSGQVMSSSPGPYVTIDAAPSNATYFILHRC